MDWQVDVLLRRNANLPLTMPAWADGSHSDCGARLSNSETKASVVDKPFEVDAGVAVETGLFGRLVVPADPARATEIQDLARQAAVWATRTRGEGTLRAYRSAWTAYSAWCDRLGFAPLAGDADVIGMYLVKAAERLTVPTRRHRHRPPPRRG
ncbi:hypothetical protein [Azospirillum brasilense]|uniref:hypothetical protein n=1 Tax=Azospirillum brasilense TaxID=192 RepID=UPI0003A22EB8|nr:hypothetical protein [Azospirillum brasilense]